MIVDCAHYKDGKRQHEGTIPLEQAAERAGDGVDDFVWIGLHDPEPGTLDELKKLFHLHELAVEDAEQTHGRPKIEDYDEMWFIVLKTAHYHEDREEVHFGEVHVFAGPGFAITVRHGPGSELSPARSRLEVRPDLLRMGPAAVVWAVMDKVVDDYGPVVEGIEDDIEEVEVEVFDDDQPAPTHRIYALKREVVEFHRALGPLLGPLDEIERGKYERIPVELRRFFRDVYDHARRADEQVSSQRELLNSVLEANLALASVAQNEVVKRISSYAAIIAVPTFIASIYGMNFDHMPELHWRIGYPLSLAVMAVLVYLLYRYFKRVNWL
ncbi:MAG: magnesium transporter [Solirubrobacterales bacterium]|jgi:magnesium transporter|nr:magnesium transporter [Solirubrobacterales bacterium]